MKLGTAFLSVVAVVVLAWQGFVIPARQVATIAKLYHVAVRVDLQTDDPAPPERSAALRDDVVALLKRSGLHPVENGWPELRVTVHEFRHAAGAGLETLNNVELTLRRGPAATDVAWTRATVLEKAPAGAPVDVRGEVLALANAFVREERLPHR